MSSEYFKSTSLHLVRLKIFECIKCLRTHLHQIQGNWAGTKIIRNWVACEFMAHYACKNAHRDESEIYYHQRFNFRIINTLMRSWEKRLTWLACNQRSCICIFGWTLREDVRLACAQTPELFFDLHVPFQLSAKEQKNNLCKCIPEHD